VRRAQLWITVGWPAAILIGLLWGGPAGAIAMWLGYPVILATVVLACIVGAAVEGRIDRRGHYRDTAERLTSGLRRIERYLLEHDQWELTEHEHNVLRSVQDLLAGATIRDPAEPWNTNHPSLWASAANGRKTQVR
jgi:hypothetical protein